LAGIRQLEHLKVFSKNLHLQRNIIFATQRK